LQHLNEQYEKIGLIGYCWGGKYSLHFGYDPKVQVCIANHPSHFELGTDLGHKKPVQLLLAEVDRLFSASLREQTRKHLEANQIEHEIQVFQQEHGWTVRGDLENPDIEKAKEDAFTRNRE